MNKFKNGKETLGKKFIKAPTRLSIPLIIYYVHYFQTRVRASTHDSLVPGQCFLSTSVGSQQAVKETSVSSCTRMGI